MSAYRRLLASPVSPLDFDGMIQNSVRQIRETAHGLTPAESDLLTDICRGRYLAGVRKVADIARHRCADAADASAFAEAIRGYILFGHPGLTLSVFDAFRIEQISNERGNLAQFEHLIAPSHATRARVAEFIHAQELASRAVVDAVWREMGRPPSNPAAAALAA